MKILTICPSIRTESLEIMKKSFDLTTKYSDIKIITDIGHTTKIINDTFNKYPDYDFYHITNDDVIYKTYAWDIQLANRNKISYGNDLFQGENLCTFPMIDGNIVRALGWLQMPTLEYMYGDMVWMIIGKYSDCLRYIPDVIVEHRHSLVTNIVDEVTKKTNSQEQYNRDQLSFVKWLAYQSNKDIQKVKEVINVGV